MFICRRKFIAGVLVSAIALTGPLPRPPRRKKLTVYKSATNHAINVYDYGATGDGSTDDTANLQAAINAAQRGSTVIFPPGIYIVSSPLKLLSGVTYEGTSFCDNDGSGNAQSNGSLLRIKASTNLGTRRAIFENAEYSNNTTGTAGQAITIRNISFDGNNANIYGSGGGAAGGAITLMADLCMIEHCYIQNVKGSCLILSDRTANNSAMTNSQSTQEIIIRDNRINTCTINGIYAYSPDGLVTDCYLLDNIIESPAQTVSYSATQGAIILESGAGFVVDGNHVYGSLQHGIDISKGYATNVINNYVDGYGQDTGTTGTYYHGISVQPYMERGVTVCNNQVFCSESNTHVTYQHITVNSSGGPTNALVCDNIVGGNSKSNGYGIDIENNGAATYTVQCLGNQITKCSNPYSFNNVLTTTGIDAVGHFTSIDPSTPSISPSSSGYSITGTDVRGSITFKASSTFTNTATSEVTVTFVTAYATAPIVIVTPADKNTANNITYATSVSTTGFHVTLLNGTNGAAYNVFYHVIG